MNLYLISQNKNNDWDTFSSAVVAAENEQEASHIHPASFDGEWWKKDLIINHSWVMPNDVTVLYLGIAKEGTVKGVICSSFHAG